MSQLTLILYSTQVLKMILSNVDILPLKVYQNAAKNVEDPFFYFS